MAGNQLYKNDSVLKESVISFLKKHADIFLRNCAIAINNADIEAIHDMRVSLKRIDTFIRMLNFEKNANFRLKRCFKPLKKLFKKAGPVRNFQVQCIMIEDFKQSININESLINLFIQEKDALIQNFFDIKGTLDFLLIKRTFRIIENYVCQLTENNLLMQIENYEKNRKKLLKKFSNYRSDEFNLHQARKIIKDLSYLVEISASFIPKDDNVFTKYKLTGNLLGDWHDRAVMLNFLNKTKSKDLNAELKDIDQVIFKIDGQKETYKEKYLDEYKTWTNA